MECPHIPVLPYDGFRQRLYQKISGTRAPLSGSLELTYRCNLRCQHCYVAFGHRGVPGKQELSTGEILHLLDDLADQGCLWLLITGGEPLIRSDFAEIYTAARRKGFLVTLFTNATMVTPRIADLLAEYPPFLVEVSLYGRTQGTYEGVTAIPGSYPHALRGIELLRERKIQLKLKTMAMTLNQHEIIAMEDFARSLGLDFRYDPMINAGADHSTNPHQFRLSPEEAVAFDRANENRKGDLLRFYDQQNSVARDDNLLYSCSAGLFYFHIDPFGMLSMCMMARNPAYDLRQGSFKEGWEHFLAQVRQLPASGGNQCNTCALQPLCGQCPGWSQIEHGVDEQRVDYLCQVTHLRAGLLGIPGGKS